MVKNGDLSSYHLVSFDIKQHLSASKYCHQAALPDTIYCVWHRIEKGFHRHPGSTSQTECLPRFGLSLLS